MASNNGEIIGLLKKCTKCHVHFTSSKFDLHENDCDYDQEDENVIMLNSKPTSSPTSNNSPTRIEPIITSHKKSSSDDDNDDNDDDDCDAIGEIMGKYGKYQFLMTILLTLFQIPNTFHIASPVYQAADKNFWCERPSHLINTPINLWRNITNSTDNCHILDINWNTIQNITDFTQELTNNSTLMTKCKSWEYDSNDKLGNNWISEWNLVCDRDELKTMAESLFLVGVATGGIITGYLSDKFGRKKMLYISFTFQTMFGIALAFTNSFGIYCAIRTLLGFASVSCTYAGLILAIEFVDGKWKTIAGMYNLFPLPISYMMLSGIAYLTQDYKRLQLCISLPSLFLFFTWYVIPESPRWLLCKGRVAEVIEIVKKAVRFNKLTLPHNIDKKLIPPILDKNEEGCINLFGTKYLRLVTFCFLCIWFTINLIYYGLILNMNAFGGNVYINSALAGLVEIPAIILAMVVILKYGKKWILASTLFSTGIACLFIAIMEGRQDFQWLKITLVMIGKFTISASNTIMPVYTAELYPTAIRNAGVGACNASAGVALIILPYLSIVRKVEPYYLTSVFMIWSIIGGSVVTLLPEKMPPARRTVEPPEEERTST